MHITHKAPHSRESEWMDKEIVAIFFLILFKYEIYNGTRKRKTYIINLCVDKKSNA